MFHHIKIHRTINLNCQYLVIYKNPRDILQVQHLGRSILGKGTKEFEDIYFHATSRPHGYLLINLKQLTSDTFILLTYIFDDHPKSTQNINHFDVFILDRHILNI